MLVKCLTNLIILTYGLILPIYWSQKAMEQGNVEVLKKCVSHWITYALFKETLGMTNAIFGSWLPFYNIIVVTIFLWLINPQLNDEGYFYENNFDVFLPKDEQTIYKSVFVHTNKKLSEYPVRYSSQDLGEKMVEEWRELPKPEQASESFFKSIFKFTIKAGLEFAEYFRAGQIWIVKNLESKLRGILDHLSKILAREKTSKDSDEDLVEKFGDNENYFDVFENLVKDSDEDLGEKIGDIKNHLEVYLPKRKKSSPYLIGKGICKFIIEPALEFAGYLKTGFLRILKNLYSELRGLFGHINNILARERRIREFIIKTRLKVSGYLKTGLIWTVKKYGRELSDVCGYINKILATENSFKEGGEDFREKIWVILLVRDKNCFREKEDSSLKKLQPRTDASFVEGKNSVGGRNLPKPRTDELLEGHQNNLGRDDDSQNNLTKPRVDKTFEERQKCLVLRRLKEQPAKAKNR